LAVKGVGTQIRIASASRSAAGSVVAVKVSAARAAATSSAAMCLMYDRPACSSATFVGSVSMPIARVPPRAKARHSGRPT
jgi:hypothetical protein